MSPPALRRPPRGRSLATSAPAAGLTLLLAYLLKSFYSGAGADELGFVLAPTAALIEGLSGHVFAYEAGVGYRSDELGMVITSGCAGFNFLIAALCALSFGFTGHFPSAGARLAWVAVALCLAYGATIVANAARIGLTAVRLKMDLTLGYSSVEIHRIEGVVVYLMALFASLALVEVAFVRRRAARV